MSDEIRLSVTAAVGGREYTAEMPYPRVVWDPAGDHDREQLRLIARHRFGSWLYKETGVRLPEERLEALPVTIS